MLSFAFRNLRTRPLRSLLALCGLTVAIMGMVGLFSVAGGIQSMVTTTFARIPGLAVMQPGAPIPLFSRLPAAWGEEIRRLPGVHIVHPEVWTRAHVIEGKPVIAPPRFLFGIDIDISLKLSLAIYRNALKEGRFLIPADRATYNTVISRQIAEEFKKHVGDALRVDGRELQIVGIYDCGSQLLDIAIILDIDHVRAMSRIGSDSVCSFYVEPEPGADRDKLVGEIKELFRGRSPSAWQPSAALTMGLPSGSTQRNPLVDFVSSLHRALRTPKTPGSNPEPTVPAHNDRADDKSAGPPAPAVATIPDSPVPQDLSAPESQTSPPPDELPVEVRSPDDWVDEFKRFSADLDLFLLIMTSIGVTIAVLGIVNTMLMSVTERFIEFGILKANGWSNGDVLKLIAFESALLGVMGGVLGAALGWGATLAANANWPTRIHLYASPQLLAFSLAFSTALGIVGGLYPAIWASRMLPMEAIRRG